MSEYIEREAAIAEFSNAGSAFVYGDHCRAIVSRLNAIPAANVREVVKAVWKEEDMGWGDTAFVCSNCGETWNLEAGTPAENNMNFCPNCGADMRGEATEGEDMKDITYCASTDCPSKECKIKLLNNTFQPGEIISMADFSATCRFYIGWLLEKIEEADNGQN